MKQLGEILLESGLITHESFQSALEEEKDWGGKLATNLIKLGLASEEDIARVLSETLGLERVTLTETPVSGDALRAVEVSMAKRCFAMPLLLDAETITIAMVDPTDTHLTGTLEFVTGRRLVPVIATLSDIRWAIGYHYDKKAPSPAAAVHVGDKEIDVSLAVEGLIELLALKGIIKQDEYRMLLTRKTKGA